MAIFSRLIPVAASSYALQASALLSGTALAASFMIPLVFALIFVPQQNEKYYDLGGAVGWISTTFLSLYHPALKAKFWDHSLISLPPLSSFASRQLLVSAAVGIWAVRLGSFLAMRAIQAGGDSRFDSIRTQPMQFTGYWMAQATWITLVGLPVYLCNVAPRHVHPSLGIRDYLALGIYAGSLLFEVIADNQKAAWRKAKNLKEHDEEFISSGLWSISRHPNYVGEVGVWTGIWALSSSSLQCNVYPKGTVALAALSPVFVYLLIRKGSGVPPLENAADRKFGNNPRYREYKNTVPVFWPWGSTSK